MRDKRERARVYKNDGGAKGNLHINVLSKILRDVVELFQGFNSIFTTIVLWVRAWVGERKINL